MRRKPTTRTTAKTKNQTLGREPPTIEAQLTENIYKAQEGILARAEQLIALARKRPTERNKRRAWAFIHEHNA